MSSNAFKRIFSWWDVFCTPSTYLEDRDELPIFCKSCGTKLVRRIVKTWYDDITGKPIRGYVVIKCTSNKLGEDGWCAYIKYAEQFGKEFQETLKAIDEEEIYGGIQ